MLTLTCRCELPELVPQASILLLEPINLHLEVFHPLSACDAQLLDNLDKPPQTQDDNERCNLLDNTMRQDVDEKTGDNDCSIKDMEPGMQEPGPRSVRVHAGCVDDNVSGLTRSRMPTGS